MNLDMMGVGKKRNMYQEPQISVRCFPACWISICS